MSIRLRLALWYTAVLAVTLIVFSLLLYFLMARHLIDEGDASIASRAQHIASTIRVDGAAPPTLPNVELPPIDAFESLGVYVQVVQTDGTAVARSDNLGGVTVHTYPSSWFYGKLVAWWLRKRLAYFGQRIRS